MKGRQLGKLVIAISAWAFLCLAFGSGHAQGYSHRNLSVQEGMSQSQVMSMAQDDKGYLWFGTKGGGLSRFDGMRFVTYTTDDGLPGNSVTGLDYSPDGKLWMICDERGLYYYDGQSFTGLDKDKQVAIRSGSTVRCAKDGGVWAASQGDGLLFWDGKAGRHYLQANGLPSDSVFCTLELPSGEVWAGTSKGIGVIQAGRASALNPSAFANAPTRFVRSMIMRRDGSIWGCQGDQLWHIKPGERTFTYVLLPQLGTFIHELVEDRAGKLWLALDRGAAFLGDSLVRFGLDDGVKDIPSNGLLLDDRGNIWLGTNGGGAVRFTPQAFDMLGAGTPFESGSAFAIVEPRPGLLYIGTEHGMFELHHGAVRQVKEVPDPEAFFLAIHTEAGGKLVLSTRRAAYRWDGRQARAIRHATGDTARFSTSITGPDGNNYGVERGRVYRIGPDSTVTVPLPYDRMPKVDGQIFIDSQGSYWLHSNQQGVSIWDGQNLRTLRAPHDLTTTQIYGFHEDRNQHVWMGTEEGLLRVDETGSCYLSKREGLSGNIIYSMVNDEAGHLWAGTENGLSRIDLDAHSNPVAIRTYGPAEGFTGIECNQGSTLRDSRGRLWFGTIEGLTSYDPRHDVVDLVPPQVQIVNFRVNLEEIDWRERGLSMMPWTRQPIDPVLEPDEDHIRIDFAGVTQYLPERVQYRYILKGEEIDSSEITDVSYAVYSKLPPGDYTFQVLACNANGIWSLEPAEIHFRIKAPFYKTTWFGIIAFLLCILLVVGIVGLRTRTLRRQREALETKVKQRTEALEQANQVKSEFLAKMSHEIRTPMNGVIGMTELLERTSLNPQQRKFLENIRVSGQNLLSLINDILDFSRIESGKMELEHIPFDLRHLIEEVTDILAFGAFSKGLELIYWVDPDIRGPIVGDPARLKQVITNLVGNAVKFTASGEISIKARLLRMEGETAVIQLSVKDSGIGIPKDKHASLFDSFTQVDASTTRKYGGTGLGLAISYSLSRMMGGEMWVESEPGHGSEFLFTIKTGISGPWKYPGESHPAKNLEGKTVVVAMQNKANLSLLEEYMSHWGVKMVTLSTIEAASDMALDDPDVQFLIVDLRLSKMHPAALVQTVANTCEKRGLHFAILAEPDVSIPLLSLVSDSGWILPKPLKRDDLLAALMGQRPNTEPHELDDKLQLLGAQVPLRILVAEDNPINQDVAIGMLGNLGYKVTIAQDGLEALDAVLQEDYDLIFMDVQMPVMDGIEATKRIIAQVVAERRPLIVAMTANAMESDRQRCLQAGMDTFISKPFVITELMRMLRTVPDLRARKAAGLALEPSVVAPPPQQSPEEPPAPEQKRAPQTAPMEAERLTDMAMLDGVSGGDRDFVLGILHKLVIKMPEAVQELMAAAKAQDWENVRATAHRNKSSAAYSGSERLRDMFKDIEHMARDSQDLDKVPQRIEELGQFVEAVVVELNQRIEERAK